MDLFVETSGNKRWNTGHIYAGVDECCKSAFRIPVDRASGGERATVVYFLGADKRGPDSGTHLSPPHRLVLFN